MNNFFTQSSSWLHVVFTIERCLCVTITTWRIWFNSKRAMSLSVGILIVFFDLNFHEFFNITYGIITVEMGNSSYSYSSCIYSKLHFISMEVYVYSIIPFGLIIISNFILVRSVVLVKGKTIKRSEEDKAKRRAMSVTVVFN